MSRTVSIELAGLVFLLAGSAFFSATEIALFALSKLQVRRLRQDQPTRGQLISELLDKPQRLLSAILFGDTLITVATAILGYDLLQRLAPHHADVLAVPVMTLLLLVCGEVTPKAILIRRPEYFAPKLAPFVNRFERGTRQVRRGFEVLAEAVVRHIEQWSYFASRRARDSAPTSDEYRTLLTVSEQAGVVRREERDMVHKILALDKMHIREVMTPRVDMQCIEDTLTPDAMASALRQIKHRRVPIIHDSPDTIEGMLNVKEFLMNPHRELDEVIELPNFVPDTMSVGKLLKTFRKQEHPVAIVVDEYGGTQGMVTLEDILEEIIGEIEDEFDTREILIQKLDPGHWLINGKTKLELVNAQCGLNLHAAGSETLAGWMLAQLGSLPHDGEEVRAGNVRVIAVKVIKNRVRELMLEVAG
ncbi:MAG: hemolysin family protein [Verrucomicrobiota bacterium]